MECTSVSLYESLRHCQGEKVIPGIRQRIYAIAKRDILTWPTLPEASSDATLSTLAAYSGNFTLAADKKWQRIDLALNKGNVECETQGDRPSRLFLNKLTATYPGIEEEATGFCRLAIDDDLVFLVQQRNGKFRVLGNEMFETDVQPKLSTGEGTDTAGGTELAIEVADICPAPFYPGKIETADDGDLNGATGQPWTETTA